MQYAIDYFHHQVVQLQFGLAPFFYEVKNIIMHPLQFRFATYERRMQIIITEKFCLTVDGRKLPGKIVIEIKNAAFVRDDMSVRDRAFITRFGDENATTIGVK